MGKLKKYIDTKVITVVILVIAVVFVIVGSTFAYWRWNSTEEQQTSITFTSTAAFTCSADGGGNITNATVQFQPGDCTDTDHAIKRKITYSRDISQENLSIDYNLFLDVKELGAGLSNSANFKYAVTSSATSCNTDVITSGKVTNKVPLIEDTFTGTGTKEAYLWIWLDKTEEDSATMNQEFRAVLNGTCEVSSGFKESKMLLTGSNFNTKVYKDLATVYQDKTGQTDFNPQSLTFYSNGNLPDGISKETLMAYASVDVSNDQNGKIKAFYNDDNVYIYSDEQIFANINSMGMFSSSPSLTLNLEQLDTSHVENMTGMFAGSKAITLDLSHFDTSHVTNMTAMFQGAQFTTLNLSGFDTSNVTIMTAMFNSIKIDNLDLSNFDTSKVTGMSMMFYQSQITTLNFNNFDMSSLTAMTAMFNESKIDYIDLSGVKNASNISEIDISAMFARSSASTIDISGFDFENYTGRYPISSIFGVNDNPFNLIVKNQANKDYFINNTDIDGSRISIKG